ncbi:MAG: zinc ribbon domain-containing protein [Oscillospiraceae bacterium]|nr:zinc ribbon domain-containing protein [Oscillospiraceae bacterium]
MKCPNCGFDIDDNEVYCQHCGAEIVEMGQPEGGTGEKKKKTKPAKDGEGKNRLSLILKLAAAAVILVVIIIIIVSVAASVNASKGRKLFDNIPLGRDVDFIVSQTGMVFLSEESSEYGALNYIADYDHICEAEKSVTVDGIKLPEWAVLLRENASGSVEEAVLYNFSILKNSWMGEKTGSKIEASAVEFGAKIRAAERAIGLKPYTIIKESAENTSTYVYRYHYTDEESGNYFVMNFYVIVNDVDGKVVDVREEQLDYLNLILHAE